MGIINRAEGAMLDEDDPMTAELNDKLRGHFSLGRRLLNLWKNLPLDRAFERTKCPLPSTRIGAAMSVRVCRQFHAVLELLKRGEAAVAHSTVRSMFESNLVLAYVLFPRFKARRFNRKGDVHCIISEPGFPLTRERRAWMYGRYLYSAKFQHAESNSDRRGFKKYMRGIAKKRETSAEQYFLKKIGPAWAKRQSERPYTYSCLSISDLSHSLGRTFASWYVIVYPDQSNHVHASDAEYFLHMSESGDVIGRWFSDVRETRMCMELAITMFLTHAFLLNEYIDLGIAANTALNALKTEYVNDVLTQPDLAV